MKFRSPLSWAFLVVVSFASSLWAQPAITRSDFWQIGDTFKYLGIQAGNLTPGAAGNGVTWTFSNLNSDANDDVTFSFVAASSAENSQFFPNANIAQVATVEGTTAANFYAVSNTRIVEEGQSTPVGNVILENKRILVDFPFNFNSPQTDEFGGTFELLVSGFLTQVMRTGSWTNTYDGFGTLVLNGKTFNNVKRIKSVQEVTDVSNVSGVALTTIVRTTSYTWFSSDYRTPLFNYVEGETNVLGQVTNSKSATMLDVDGMGMPTPTNSRYGAHLTNQSGNFDTELIIRNPTSDAQVLTLNPFGSDGSALTPVEINLSGNQTIRMLQQSYFPADAVAFNSSGCSQCIFTTGYRADLPDGSTAHVLQATDINNEYYFYPGEWDILFDGAALINTGSDAATINATQIGDDGTVLAQVNLAQSLPAGGKYLGLFNDLFVNNANSIVKLESSQPLAVMILRISQDFRYLYQNFPLPAAPSGDDERWLAHITSDTGGFGSSIIAHNRGNTPEVVILQPYDANGQGLTPVPVTVNGNSVFRMAKAELLPSETSHLSITGAGSNVLVSVGYQSNQPNSSTAQIHESAPVGTEFYIYPGEWDYLFDGLAIINTGDQNASVIATQIRDDGLTVGNISLHADLPPNAKYLAVLEGMLAPNPNAILKIESTQPMAILALRLSKDSRFLYGNSTIE